MTKGELNDLIFSTTDKLYYATFEELEKIELPNPCSNSEFQLFIFKYISKLNTNIIFNTSTILFEVLSKTLNITDDVDEFDSLID